MHRIHAPKSRQRGLSMFGFLFTAVLLVLAAMVAMKLVPAYIEFFSVKKILNAMSQDGSLSAKSNAEIRSDFGKRASVDYVTGVKPEQLVIDRRGGGAVVSVDYEFRTKLIGNVSLVVDFSASTDPNRAPRIE